MALFRHLKPYGITAITVGLISLLHAYVVFLLGEKNPFFLFTLAILISAWVGGLGPSLLGVSLCLIIDSLFFTLSQTAFSSSQITRTFIFLITSGLIITICEQLHQAQRRMKAAREELYASENRFHALADYAPILIWMTDTTKATWFNRPWLKFTGRTLEQEFGEGWSEGIHPDDVDRCIKIYTTSFDVRKPFEMDYRLRRHDGEYRWILDRAIPMFSANGSFTGYIGGCIDIHERKEAEQNRETHLCAERAARVEAERIALLKDEFLATVSHEIRTPLTAILGWAQLLRMNALTGDELPEAIKTIERNARAQAKLIEDLLDMSRILSGRMHIDMQQVKLQDVIEAALATAEPTSATKKIHILRVLDSKADCIVGDPIRLQQVIWNLLNNAIKFTPPGGKITLTLDRIDSHLKVSVSDTGEGITPEFLPYVFDRFRQENSTSSRRHQGLGLGLAIVKQLVELHGGTVHATSPGPGKGATFTICLPISAVYSNQDTKSISKTSGKETSTTRNHEIPILLLAGTNLLVVDDDQDTREMLRSVLEQNGAHVRTSSSAAEALIALDLCLPDLLISDIGMPDEDGYTLIQKIRERSHQLPAVALTAFARNEDHQRAINAGFQMHLTKPIEPTKLITVVSSFTKKRHP